MNLLSLGKSMRIIFSERTNKNFIIYIFIYADTPCWTMLLLCKTFLEHTFQNVVQYCRYMPLNIKNIRKLVSFIAFLIFGKGQKSHVAKFGELSRWSNHIALLTCLCNNVGLLSDLV